MPVVPESVPESVPVSVLASGVHRVTEPSFAIRHEKPGGQIGASAVPWQKPAQLPIDICTSQQIPAASQSSVASTMPA